jgi:hypothetical protein
MNHVMAKLRFRRSDGKDSRPLASDETGGLSTRMRELISIATLEERRKSRVGKRSGPAGERRRRNDEQSPEQHTD